jgi:hypothetical protein
MRSGAEFTPEEVARAQAYWRSDLQDPDVDPVLKDMVQQYLALMADKKLTKTNRFVRIDSSGPAVFDDVASAWTTSNTVSPIFRIGLEFIT